MPVKVNTEELMRAAISSASTWKAADWRSTILSTMLTVSPHSTVSISPPAGSVTVAATTSLTDSLPEEAYSVSDRVKGLPAVMVSVP